MPTPSVPSVPDRGYKVTNRKKVLLFEADDGSREFRVKQTKKRKIEMVHNRRTKSEHDAMVTFWDANYPGVQVECSYPDSGETVTGWIDSDLNVEWHAVNLVSFSWVFQEA
jgi:hypothetical protein